MEKRSLMEKWLKRKSSEDSAPSHQITTPGGSGDSQSHDVELVESDKIEPSPLEESKEVQRRSRKRSPVICRKKHTPESESSIDESEEEAEQEQVVEEAFELEAPSGSDDDESGTGDNPAEVRKKRKLWNPKLQPEKIVGDFPWLDTTKGFPFCKLCHSKLAGGKFHLRRHERSSIHVKKMKMAKDTPKVETFLKNSDKTLRAISRAEIKLSAYLCRRNLALLTMDSLSLLCSNIFSDSNIAKGVKMKRKKATQLIVGVLAPFFKQSIVKDLMETMFTIIIDETTDISVDKSLVVILRYWKDGTVKDKIFDLIKVESGDADTIFNSIKSLLDENKIPYANVLAFGADGASTMMGNVKGVQARLKEIIPHLYVQTCLCHSLHLCTSYASKELPNVIEQFVRDIYGYFCHSSKRSKELAECQIFAQEKPHKMLHPCQTRWLSLKAVVDRVLEQWNPLNLFFQRAALEDDLPTAKTILNALRNPVFKMYLLFLSYILEVVVNVNKELQSEGSKFPILLERFTTLYKLVNN